MTDVEDDRLELFVNMKPCRALFAIQNLKDSEAYPTNISKKIDSTYAHTVGILERFENAGLVDSQKDGRKKMLKLTDQGSTLAEDLRPFIDDLQSTEKQSLGEMISES